MSTSDETLKKSPDTEAILGAIAQLSNSIASVAEDVSGLKADLQEVRSDLAALTLRVDGLERFVIVQFEAVREGIEYNSAKFDRLEAKIYDARSDISNMRADIKELAQLVRKKELV